MTRDEKIEKVARQLQWNGERFALACRIVDALDEPVRVTNELLVAVQVEYFRAAGITGRDGMWLSRDHLRAALEAVLQAAPQLPNPELVSSMRELGFIVGRNPDGVDDSVASTLLTVRKLLERGKQLEKERADFIAVLNEDADGRMILDLDQLREDVKHPCALCGWTLDGHNYMYETERGTAHLHCSHTLRGAQLDKLKARVEQLEKVAEAARTFEYDAPYIQYSKAKREVLRTALRDLDGGTE